jgi:hypothetical protein
LLDIDPEQEAALACADARRVQRAAQVDGHRSMVATLADIAAPCAEAGSPPRVRAKAGTDTVRAYDQLLDDAHSSEGLSATIVVILCVMLALGVPAGLLAYATDRHKRAAVARFAILAFGVAAISVGLTYGVEKIPQPFDDVVRGSLFGVGNLLLLLGVLFPSQAARQTGRVPALFLAMLPGAIAWSYPTNTPHEALAGLSLGAVLWWFAPHADVRAFRSILHGAKALPWWRIVLGVLGIVGLLPAGYYHGDPTPPFLHQRPWLVFLLGVLAIAAWLAAGARARDGRLRHGDLGIAFVASVASLLLRDRVPPVVGLVSMLSLPMLSVVALQRRRFTLAFGLGLSAWAWVSRDTEVMPLLCAALVLEAVGHSARGAARSADPDASHRPWMLASLSLVLFGGAFLTRAALQGGLDLTNIDYNVGAFGDPHVSEVRAALAMIWKFLSAFMLLLACLVLPLSKRAAMAVALAFSLVFVVRAGTLSWMLFACRTSYWTALRTMSDCPSALIATWAGIAVLWIVAFAGRSRFLAMEDRAHAG